MTISASRTAAFPANIVGSEYPIMAGQTTDPSWLWKRMTSDQRLQAAKAFWLDEQGTDDQPQAVVFISQQKNFARRGGKARHRIRPLCGSLREFCSRCRRTAARTARPRGSGAGCRGPASDRAGVWGGAPRKTVMRLPTRILFSSA